MIIMMVTMKMITAMIMIVIYDDNIDCEND